MVSFRKDLNEQNEKQLEVLETYSQYLVPGGKLVYAVCSIDQSEGENIIRAFLANHPDFVFDTTFKTSFEDADCGAYLMPSDKGESGYFVSRLIRNT